MSRTPQPPMLSKRIEQCIDGRCGLSSEQFSYKLANSPIGAFDGTVYGLDIALPDKLDIDESKMSVWVVYADGSRRDGVGDRLRIGGINTERHRKLPNVLFDHGKQVQLPFGMSCERDEKGAYDYAKYCNIIDPNTNNARLNCFVYQGKGVQCFNGVCEPVSRDDEYAHAIFCEQLYHMLCKRLLGAGSIGYQVRQAVQLPADYETGTPAGLDLIEVLMLEGSVVVTPANMDTVRKACSKGFQCCGKDLSPVLVKSLQPYLPRQTKTVSGYEAKKADPQTGFDIKEIGVGKFYVMDAEGNQRDGPFDTRDEAQKMLERYKAEVLDRASTTVYSNRDKMMTSDAAERLGMTVEDFLKLADEAGVRPGKTTTNRVSAHGNIGGPRDPSATAVNWTDNQLNKIGIYRREKREREAREGKDLIPVPLAKLPDGQTPPARFKPGAGAEKGKTMANKANVQMVDDEQMPGDPVSLPDPNADHQGKPAVKSLAVGMDVRIIDGPNATEEGRVVKISSDGSSCVVKLSSGRTVQVLADADHIRPVGKSLLKSVKEIRQALRGKSIDKSELLHEAIYKLRGYIQNPGHPELFTEAWEKIQSCGFDVAGRSEPGIDNARELIWTAEMRQNLNATKSFIDEVKSLRVQYRNKVVKGFATVRVKFATAHMPLADQNKFIGEMKVAGYAGPNALNSPAKELAFSANLEPGKDMDSADATGSVSKAMAIASKYRAKMVGEKSLKAASEQTCPKCGGKGCPMCGGSGKIAVADDKNHSKGKTMPNAKTKDAPVQMGDTPVYGGDGGDRHEGDEPFGAQVLRAMHEDHGQLMKRYDDFHKSMHKTEHAHLIPHMEETMKGIDKHMSKTEKLFNKHYGDLSPLEGAMGDKDAPDAAVEADSSSEPSESLDDAVEGQNKEPNPQGKKSMPNAKKKSCTCGATKDYTGQTDLLPEASEEIAEISGDSSTPQIPQHHWDNYKGAHGYLKEVGEGSDWSDEWRHKAYHHYSNLMPLLDAFAVSDEEREPDISGKDVYGLDSAHREAREGHREDISGKELEDLDDAVGYSDDSHAADISGKAAIPATGPMPTGGKLPSNQEADQESVQRPDNAAVGGMRSKSVWHKATTGVSSYLKELADTTEMTPDLRAKAMHYHAQVDPLLAAEGDVSAQDPGAGDSDAGHPSEPGQDQPDYNAIGEKNLKVLRQQQEKNRKETNDLLNGVNRLIAQLS